LAKHKVELVEVQDHEVHAKKTVRELLADLGGWRVTDVSVGYLSDEAKIGSNLTVSVGVQNLSDLPIKIDFLSAAKILLKVVDRHGTELYSTKSQGAGSSEVLGPTEGASWTDQFYVDPAKFNNADTYTISGQLNTAFSGGASVILKLS
jgi:hypothetical protein